MNRHFSAILAGAVTFAMSATTALAIDIACLTTNPSSQDWVPKGVLVKIDPKAFSAAVLDEFTVEVFKDGVLAELTRPQPDRIHLNWKLVGVKDRQGRAQNVNFTMTINTKRMSFNYSGVGESNFLTPGAATGKCLAKS